MNFLNVIALCKFLSPEDAWLKLQKTFASSAQCFKKKKMS